MDKVAKTKEVLSSINSNRAILFFSCGKDSLVALDLMHPYFDEIECVFMYFVKGLEHIERWIRWAEKRYPKAKFTQVPHWNLTYILKSGLYCTQNLGVKTFKVATVDESMRLRTGINWTFYGMKKADSLNRRLMLMGYENGVSDTQKVYPLSEWTNKEVLAYMRSRKIPEPVRYSKNASGGVGFNIDCYLWMRNNHPEDLKKVLKAFPQSEKILWDFDEFRKREELPEEEALKLYKKK